MRLQNIQNFKSKTVRVVLDDTKTSTNYIETTKGVYFEEKETLYLCLKCMKPANWLTWTDKNHAKSTCECGQEHRLSIMPLDQVAISL